MGKIKATDSKDDGGQTSLEELLGAVGKPKAGALEAILEGHTDSELVAVGRTIVTSRIVTDGVRLYGRAQAFYAQASAEQKALLKGFSPGLLALAVHQLADLDAMEAKLATDADGAGVEQAETAAAASEAWNDALALRDQAHTALLAAAGTKALRARADAAVGTAASGAELARGLEALGGLLEDWLAKKDAKLHTRLELRGLDGHYATELGAGAKSVRSSSAKASKKTNATVTQAALDRADGVNVLLLGQIIRAFEGAHDRNATIPRLVPIATRRLFDRRTKSAPADDGSGDAPTPPADKTTDPTKIAE